jgi:hypothetical protein
MTLWQFPDADLTMVEAQARSRALAEKSVLWNGVADRVQIVAGDLREVAPRAPDFDVVTGSPPYFDASAGVVSALPQRAPCRFELRGGVEGYVQAMAAALRLGGVGALVMAAFWLGTVPALVLASNGARVAFARLGRMSSVVAGLAMVAVGLHAAVVRAGVAEVAMDSARASGVVCASNAELAARAEAQADERPACCKERP